MYTFRNKKLYMLYMTIGWNNKAGILQTGAVFVLYAAKNTPQKMGQV